MNRDDLLNKIMELEQQMNSLQQGFIELKQQTVDLVEENVALKLERDNMQRMIQSPKNQPKKLKSLQSKDNLAMLYAEGFHICRGELFGKHRGGGDCMFCLSLLDSE
ncbi:DNA replication initiation control protein YabA [Macrococcus lamae]|uniref:DNA replication initiation control protein YabA n=1 Tax=Macrococcus lamae TaxID=198484 RepID=A0A4R6BSQ1_9STAP|nr:DNA replication initiation control protein YabA [Macrococcus lamae]TDM07210.1 DNA replication initiation control protein YabA [Macrococcus lamae]